MDVQLNPRRDVSERTKHINAWMHQRFGDLMQPIAGRDYFAVTAVGLGDAQRTLAFDTVSTWAGWADESRRHELRKPRLVYADKMLESWAARGVPGIAVNDELGAIRWLDFGGHAVVERSIAGQHIPGFFEPVPFARATRAGFISIDSVPPAALRHAPTPKQRMRVFRRDKYRCRVCGRKPDDYTDIELHVHHIQPWGTGALTEDSNLITLCQTCHKGLHPHFEPALFDLITPMEPQDPVVEYWESVRYWQEGIAADLEKLEASRTKQQRRRKTAAQKMIREHGSRPVK